MTAYISGTFRIPLHLFLYGWPTFTRDSTDVGKSKFRTYCQYRVHMIQYHDRGLFSCAYSGSNYTIYQKDYLRNHLKRHSNERPSVCRTELSNEVTILRDINCHTITLGLAYES